MIKKHIRGFRDNYLAPLLTMLLLFAAASGNAQVKQNYPQYGGTWNRLYLKDTGAFRLPTTILGVKDANAGLDTAQLWYDKADSSVKVYTGYQWRTIGSGGGGSGTVTSVGSGYGLSGGAITSSGTLLVDSAFIATRLRLQKVADSLAALIGGGGGSPGGSNTQYQYNNSSAFGGTNMTYNNSTGATTLTSSSNTTQFKILAHSGQTNTNPIFQLRTSANGNLLDIHSDYETNFFAGVGTGANNVFSLSVSGYDNTFTGFGSGGSNTTGYLNTYYGKRSGALNLTGVANTNLGAGAGQNNLSNYNVNVGYHAGFGNKHGNGNVVVGTEAGFTDSTMFTSTIVGRQAALNGIGLNNVAIFGFQAGLSGSGDNNSYFGTNSGYSNLTGVSNVFMGVNSGYSNTGSYNTFLGNSAGQGNTGSSNVFIGSQAGYNASTRSNRLMIDNSTTDRPLLDGDFAADTLTINGSVGIGAVTVASSILNLSSTTKGFLTPRMTASQRTSISSPATGLEVYDTDSLKKFVYNGSAWKSLAYTTDISSGGSGSGTVNSGNQYRLAYYATTGTAVSEAAAITANRALISDANGVPTHATTTATEIGYVNGVTSAIQTQLNAKAATSTTINTTSPLSGGGDLSANRTLAIADAAADGSTKGAASFTAADFNATSGNISIDYTNGQKATPSQPGFMTAAQAARLDSNTYFQSGEGVEVQTINDSTYRWRIKAFQIWDSDTATTTNATITTASTINCPNDGAGVLTVTMVGVKTDGTKYLTGEKKIQWTSSGGVVTLRYTTEIAADFLTGFTTATWTVDASGGTLRIRVTGEATENVEWSPSYTMKYHSVAL